MKNESNYDLQLQGLDGKLHLLSKKEITEQIREPESLMPAVHSTGKEMQDLLAYLTSLESDNASVRTTLGGAFAEGESALFGDPQSAARQLAHIHGQIGGNRYSPLHEIDAGNVARLARNGSFPFPSRGI